MKATGELEYWPPETNKTIEKTERDRQQAFRQATHDDGIQSVNRNKEYYAVGHLLVISFTTVRGFVLDAVDCQSWVGGIPKVRSLTIR